MLHRKVRGVMWTWLAFNRNGAAHMTVAIASGSNPRWRRIGAQSPLAALLVLGLLLSGCQKMKGEDTEQVAAEVNGSEISVHQVKSYLSLNPALNGAGGAAAGRALDLMVEQEQIGRAHV